MRPLPFFALALLLSISAPARADTSTWTVLSGGGTASSASDTLKGLAITLDDDTFIDDFSPWFSSSGTTVRFGIWENTGGSSWSVVWDQSVYISASGYTSSSPNVLLDGGQTYFFGYWLDATLGYHWTSASLPQPGFGQTAGRITRAATTFPTSFSNAYDSTLGGYRMNITATTVTDGDFDGYDSDEDCDDGDPNTYPFAPELCDGLDNDCDGLVGSDEADSDFDGSLLCEGDCDDFSPSVWPGAPELCDGQDNDCDAQVDEDLTFDADADGFSSWDSCEGSADDCDDGDPDVNPAATEACDGVDNDCDGDQDEGFAYDGDGDFFTNADCGGDDCDDTSAVTFPGAPEQCDGEDNDCDGTAPDDELVDEDGDGETACTDCDDNDADVHTGQIEDCGNGIDDNCNGQVDESGDEDGDGYGACDDCDDLDPTSTTVADDVDCDGTVTADDCDDTDPSVTDCPAQDITVQGMTLLALPAGTFDMGCTPSQSGCGSDESPVHEVTLTHDFWLGETELTQGQWEALMGNNPSWFGPNGAGTDCGSNCPLEKVNWWESLAFANAVSAAEGLAACYTLTGCTNTVGNDMECTGVTVNAATVYDCAGYRLPTEAEWEYAARAGTDLYLYAGSNTVDDVAWYNGNASSTTHAVAGKLANDWGLSDMSGNVWEWTWDWYSSTYPSSKPITDPEGSSTGADRVIRGGSWNGTAAYARVANRYPGTPGARAGTYVGIRLSRTIP